MKYLLSILLIASISNGCWGQFHRLQVYNGKVMAYDSAMKLMKNHDTSYSVSRNIQGYIVPIEPDTVKVIMLVCDTTRMWDSVRSRPPYVYWVKGYKVIADYDIYYLDILKRPFSKSVIVWLDQNL